MPTDLTGSPTRGSAGLVDILDRALDKGLAVAGGITVSLLERRVSSLTRTSDRRGRPRAVGKE